MMLPLILALVESTTYIVCRLMGFLPNSNLATVATLQEYVPKPSVVMTYATIIFCILPIDLPSKYIKNYKKICLLNIFYCFQHF